MNTEKENVSVCPYCSEQYVFEVEMLGQKARCYACKNKFTVEHIKVCPYCSEIIKYTAKKCKYCGEYLDKYMVSPQNKSKGKPVKEKITGGMNKTTKKSKKGIIFGYSFGILFIIQFFVVFSFRMPRASLKPYEWWSTYAIWCNVMLIVFVIAFVFLNAQEQDEYQPQEETSIGRSMIALIIVVVTIMIFLINIFSGCSSETSISHSNSSYEEVQKANKYIKDYESGKIYSDIINEGRKKNGCSDDVKISKEYMKVIIEQQKKK